jgi:mxaC protein
MNIRFDHLALLALLPLAVLPWLRTARSAQPYSSLELLPADAVSHALGVLLRVAASLAIASCVLGAAGPYQPETLSQRVGHGAQIVVLLDRSRSMDLSFANPRGDGVTLVQDSKGRAARRLLARFAANRPNDLIAMMEFTNIPIRVMGFTQDQQVIQSVIQASSIGRGLAQTDIGKAILAAVPFFEGQRYNGSRVILMVSDGGAHLDWVTQQRIAEQLKREKVSLYWLYLRSARSPGLLADAELSPENQDAIPEHFLHKYFQNIGIPYQAYEAENPNALERAIQDIDRQENLPIRYTDELPRRDLSRVWFGIALACAALLLGAKLLEIERWR